MSTNYRSTLEDKLECFADKSRDPRIESANGCLFASLDDDGYGEFSFAVSDAEAAALIADGYCRDAR